MNSSIWEQIDQLFEKIDVNGSGKITFEMFKNHMRKLVKLGCYDRRVDFENGPERKLADVPNSRSEQEHKFLEFEEN